MQTLKLNRTIKFEVAGTFPWNVEMNMLTVSERLEVSSAFADEDSANATRFVLQLLVKKLVSITSTEVQPETGSNFLPEDSAERLEVLTLDYPFGIDFINSCIFGYLEALAEKVNNQKKG